MTLIHSGASELDQLMEGTTAGALIPEIVRRGFQDLLEAEVSAVIGAQRHERCPAERATHRNGYRERLLTTSGFMVSIVTALVSRSNPPLEWTGHHQCLASPPPAPCLPLRSSVRMIRSTTYRC